MSCIILQNLIVILVTVVTFGLQSNSANVPANENPWAFPFWLGGNENTTSMGILCESGNDEIGQKLGCDCFYPRSTPKTDLVAKCTGQNIGTEQTLLPRRLNVSRHVRTLNFANNQFLVLNSETFGDVEGITELSFAKNLLHKVEDLNMTRLSKIDLSYNLITNLTENAFANCSELQEIDLSFNHLTFIETDVFSQLRFLKILNLASNHIGMAVEYYDEYPFKLTHLEFLEELNLSNNSLSDFPSKILKGTMNIKRLYLRNNKIFSMPYEDDFPTELADLEELDISGNFFNVISPNEFFGFPGLQKLKLDYSRDLTMIEKYAFSGLSSLNEITCQKSHRLTFIDPLAFQADPNLANATKSSPKIVRLGDNGLTYIEYPLLVWNELEDLDLYRNPWQCDCNLQWVAKFREHKSIEAAILIDTDFVCHTPPTLRGMPVASIEPDKLLCYSKTAGLIGIIGLAIFGVLLITFCILVALSAVGVLPNWFKKYRVFNNGSDLPKYSRVNPKPHGRRNTEGHDNEAEVPPDLEWDDSADVGR